MFLRTAEQLFVTHDGPTYSYMNAISFFSVESLSEALRDWGGDLGSVVVISHDRNFCDKVGFTHVVTVDNGELVMEQRGAKASDWEESKMTLQRMALDDASPGDISELEMDEATRKKAYNAPKRIHKIEELIDENEAQIAALDEEMLSNGSDVGKLVDLTQARNQLNEQVVELMEEWEELEALLEHLR